METKFRLFGHENINPQFEKNTQPRKKGDRGKMAIHSIRLIAMVYKLSKEVKAISTN